MADARARRRHDDQGMMSSTKQGQSCAEQRPALTLEAVTVQVGRGVRGVTVFGPVSATFEPGTMTTIMGASGSGKSTLLHVAAGLRPPTVGKVLFGSLDLVALSERRLSRLRRDAFSFVFQSYNLLPSLNVFDNVALPLRLRWERGVRDRVTNALAAVGLENRAQSWPAQLSGGQAQRVAIARALASRPRLLFGDEPTGALDRAATGEVMGALKRVVESGTGVVLVTHDERVARLADQTLQLASGTLSTVDVPASRSRLDV